MTECLDLDPSRSGDGLRRCLRKETGPVLAKEEEQPALSGFFFAAVIGRGRETVDRWRKFAAARGGCERADGTHKIESRRSSIVDSAGWQGGRLQGDAGDD